MAVPALRRLRARQRGYTQRGYTLIEVVVAFALLALGLTLLLGTLSNASRLVRQSADGGRATLYAQSLLDQVGVGVAMQPGRREGELEGGRYHWTLVVSPYVDRSAPPQPPTGTEGGQLFELVLRIDWGGDAAQHLQLRSLRFSEPEVL